MAKAKAKKTKTPKKSAPATGMVVKSTVAPTYGKASSFIANKNFSSAKKGGITSTPRKAK